MHVVLFFSQFLIDVYFWLYYYSLSRIFYFLALLMINALDSDLPPTLVVWSLNCGNGFQMPLWNGKLDEASVSFWYNYGNDQHSTISLQFLIVLVSLVIIIGLELVDVPKQVSIKWHSVFDMFNFHITGSCWGYSLCGTYTWRARMDMGSTMASRRHVWYP